MDVSKKGAATPKECAPPYHESKEEAEAEKERIRYCEIVHNALARKSATAATIAHVCKLGAHHRARFLEHLLHQPPLRFWVLAHRLQSTVSLISVHSAFVNI